MEKTQENVVATDEDALIQEGMYDQDFNPRLLECLGEEDSENSDLLYYF